MSDRMAFFITYANVLTRIMYSVLAARSCLFYEGQYENKKHREHMRKQGCWEMFTYNFFSWMTGNPPDRIFIQMNELSLPG